MNDAEERNDSDVQDPRIGSYVDGYVIEKRIGHGAMGTVYQARDQTLKRDVALKFPSDTLAFDPNMHKKFRKEAERAAGVDHPNIVKIFDTGVDEHNRSYIAMEYISGDDLKSIIVERGPIDEDHALKIFSQLAEALQVVHSEGIIHRDVKPQNVMVRGFGTKSEQALLTDFGLAMAVDSGSVYTTGLGTHDYMAPEVAMDLPATERSDQYSLAVVLYELLDGEPVYAKHSVPIAHIEQPLPQLSEALPGISFPTRAALERALAKNPEDRFPSVEAFQSATRNQDSHDLPALQTQMLEILGASESLTADEIAALVNEGRPTGMFVTPLQVDARARLFSQLFVRKPDGRLSRRAD